LNQPALPSLPFPYTTLFRSIADADSDRAAELIAGKLRRQQHGAADRVAPEQRALRTSQYLHAVDIAELHDAAHGTAHVDIVDIQDRKSTRLNSSHVKISYAV